MKRNQGPLQPGSVIGLLGGGQLGRMTALAAARLGYRTHVFTDRREAPGLQVSDGRTIAPFHDREALIRFAEAVDVATYEFENVPVTSAECVAGRVPVYPDPRALAVAQDRLAEKRFLRDAAIPTPEFLPVGTAADLEPAVERIGIPAVLKTRREGYDGKGQAWIRAPEEVRSAWARAGGREGVLEARVDFQSEVSVILARSVDGRTALYDPVENRHSEGILSVSLAPAALAGNVGTRARNLASRVAERLAYVGVLAVEMFLLADGGLLVNEIAPRPHNSGHWTLDAAETSQFEQQVRVCARLPLGSVARVRDAIMRNLIGEEVTRWPEFLNDGRDRLHLYGKDEIRAGRKMGHVTRLFPLGSRPDSFEHVP